MEEQGASLDAFEAARRESRRAHFALNFLVVLSALAGAVFFGYVLYVVQPFGGRQPDPVEIPTSSTGAVMALLAGEAGGLKVTLQDLDQAPEYSALLSDRMRADMGIRAEGRLYRLALANQGQSDLQIDLKLVQVNGADGREWIAREMTEAGSHRDASVMGRLRLAQMQDSFRLVAGETRQMHVFLPGDPPGMAGLASGRIDAGAAQVALKHEDIRVAQ